MQQFLFDLGPGKAVATRAGLDPRADGGRRTIFIERRCVTIRRMVRGMKMNLSLPVQSFLGVAIGRYRGQDGARYRISLTHRDPELCVTLKEARDLSASRDAQRLFAAFFAMPVLPTSDDGDRCGEYVRDGVNRPEEESPAPVPASAAKRGRARARRLTARRRRRCRLAAQRPAQIFRGEREIISYE
jgi:hypothetical protein